MLWHKSSFNIGQGREFMSVKNEYEKLKSAGEWLAFFVNSLLYMHVDNGRKTGLSIDNLTRILI